MVYDPEPICARNSFLTTVNYVEWTWIYLGNVVEAESYTSTTRKVGGFYSGPLTDVDRYFIYGPFNETGDRYYFCEAHGTFLLLLCH